MRRRHARATQKVAYVAPVPRMTEKQEKKNTRNLYELFRRFGSISDAAETLATPWGRRNGVFEMPQWTGK
jgi:hypothetical protein